MSFAAALGQRVLVGLGTNIKGSERLIRYVVDKLAGPNMEVILVHVLVSTPTSAPFADARSQAIQRMVEKRLLPILSAHHVRFRLHTLYVAMPMFMSQNPAYTVAQALCAKAANINAGAIVIGGTGKDSLARTILLGHSISYVVLRNATMPVLLVGARNAPECPEILKSRINLAELPSLAKFDAIAAAA